MTTVAFSLSAVKLALWCRYTYSVVHYSTFEFAKIEKADVIFRVLAVVFFIVNWLESGWGVRVVCSSSCLFFHFYFFC